MSTMISEAQQVLFRKWAEGTAFVLDAEKSPKAEFARLAMVKGWVGGDEMWRSCWEVCFGEVYPVSVKNAMPDIADRMRRLSIGSEASDFSVVERPERADSAGSVRSLDSEREHGSVRSWDSADSHDTVLSLGSVQSLESIAGGVGISVPGESEDLEEESKADAQSRHGANQQRELRKAMSQWYQPGFTPRPTDPFKQEFERLAQHMQWKDQDKYQHYVEMLELEIAHHFPEDMHVLKRHQDLCADLGIQEIPTTLTQCKKLLKSVNVNLFHLIDYKRNPSTNLKIYKSYRELARNIRKKSNRFPKGCAKADGFIKVLLKKAY